jgi:hypothetical protein
MFAVVNTDLRWGIGMKNRLLVTIRADLQRAKLYANTDKRMK